MGEPMRIRATMQGEVVNVRVLMAHIMETGYRNDESGKSIPAHFIQTVSVTHGDRTVLAAQWGRAVARNPYLEFRFKGGAKGDKLIVTWVDNAGDRRTDEAVIG